MHRLVEALLSVDGFVDSVCSRILLMERAEFEAWSAEGAVYHPSCRSSTDAGNWIYFFLYVWMVQRARVLPDQQGNSLLLLGTRYASLHLDALYTGTTVEIAGDVIECLLAEARLTGPVVCPRQRTLRISAGHHMREFCNQASHLVQILCDNEFVSCKQFLDPREILQDAHSLIWT